MHNDTPLGMAMHLQELDRQAAPQVASLPPKAQQGRRVAISRRSLETLLRRMRAAVMATPSRVDGPQERQTLAPGSAS